MILLLKVIIAILCIACFLVIYLIACSAKGTAMNPLPIENTALYKMWKRLIDKKIEDAKEL